MYSIQLFNIHNKKPFDAIEVNPCMVVDSNGSESIEQCEEHEAEFWSVYLHFRGEGLECIADCKTKEDAEALENLLTHVAKNFIHEPVI